jgi:hypothetical protein
VNKLIWPHYFHLQSHRRNILTHQTPVDFYLKINKLNLFLYLILNYVPQNQINLIRKYHFKLHLFYLSLSIKNQNYYYYHSFPIIVPFVLIIYESNYNIHYFNFLIIIIFFSLVFQFPSWLLYYLIIET